MQSYGFIAQLVEQGTENPRVSGSIPLEATIKTNRGSVKSFLIYYKIIGHKELINIGIKLTYNKSKHKSKIIEFILAF